MLIPYYWQNIFITLEPPVNAIAIFILINM